jgi:methylthioribose-1-phosphate isomerase
MRTVYWENDALYAIDQTAIPYKEVYLRLETVDSICDAIYKLIIRGAPCIGVSGAFAVAMAAKEAGTDDTREAFAYMKEKAPVIAKTRPTATNLSWAVDVMMKYAEGLLSLPVDAFYAKLVERAQQMADQEAANSLRVCELGASFIPKEGANILTHCNTGPLCTVDYGLSGGVAIWRISTG